MTSESCAMVYFAGKKLCRCVSKLVSMPRPLRLLHRTARGTADRFVRTQMFIHVYSVWENKYLQYSWIIFPHCSTVIAASRVLANKFQVGLVLGGGGGGVLPYISYTGTCRPSGYGFSTVRS